VRHQVSHSLPVFNISLLTIRGLKTLFLAHAKSGALRPQQAMSGQLLAQMVQATLGVLTGQRGSQPALLPAAAILLRNLAASDRAAFTAAVQSLASATDSPAAAQQLLRAAATLMDRVNFALFDRDQEEIFRENVKSFVLETRGIGLINHA
jgi:hypothetical protein